MGSQYTSDIELHSGPIRQTFHRVYMSPFRECVEHENESIAFIGK